MPIDGPDLVLARQYAPHLLFDAAEPFLPLWAGTSVFRATAPSASFPRIVVVEAPIALAIEYAVWWDWDIQHLYELEHVWVFVDDTGAVVGVESSQHGAAAAGAPELRDGRPVLYAEPGKHALTTSLTQLLDSREATARACGLLAGAGGVWITPLFRGRIADKNPENDQLVRSYLRRHAFAPSWDWSLRVDVADLPLLPWSLLDAAIPARVARRLAELRASLADSERHVLHVGHRGARAHAPENTLAAIRAAAALGAHMVELDIRLSSDGVPVLCHDATVRTSDGVETPVEQLTAAQLASLGSSPDEGVPALSDALDLCAALGLGPYLELKDERAIAPAVAQLGRHDLWRVAIVGAFQPAWVARVGVIAPQITTSVLFSGFEDDPLRLARACGASYVHPCWERHDAPHTLLTPAWLSAIRAAGLGVICWHEERPAVLRELLGLGVTGICTDRLDLLRDAAAE